MGQVVKIHYPDGSVYFMDDLDWSIYGNGIKARGYFHEVVTTGTQEAFPQEAVGEEEALEGQGGTEQDDEKTP